MRAARALGFAILLLAAAPAAAQEPAPGQGDMPEPGAKAGLTEQSGTKGGEEGTAEAGPHVNWYDWHYGKDVNGGKLDEGEQPMSPGFLFALLNFAVFFGILVKAAGPKLATFLRDRHDVVKTQLAEAARMRAEAAAKLGELESKVAGLDAEMTKLMGEIRAEAEAEREQILAAARAQGEAMKKEAQRRIEAEVARARALLEREVVDAAVAAAEKMVRERATPEDQARLFDDFIDSMTRGPGGSPPSAAEKVDQEWG